LNSGGRLKRIKEAFKDENLVEFYSNQLSFYVVMKKQTANEIEYTQDERIK